MSNPPVPPKPQGQKFDETPRDFTPRLSLKEQGTRTKSMFEGVPKPPTPQEAQQQAQQVVEKSSGYKKRAAELFTQFLKMMGDKTLAQNKNIFNDETDRELQKKLIQLAQDINQDPNEPDDLGTYTLFACFMKALLATRDRINELEYQVFNLQKRFDNEVPALIKKEVSSALDKTRSSG